MPLPDVDDFDSLGGAKANYHPVTDPTTDLDADHHNAAFVDVAGMTQTLPRAWVRLTTAATTGALVLEEHRACWGNSITVTPTLARQASGQFRITWPSTVDDELGDSHTVNLKAGVANPDSATLYHHTVVKVSANVFDLYTFDSSGVADDAVGVTWLVTAY